MAAHHAALLAPMPQAGESKNSTLSASCGGGGGGAPNNACKPLAVGSVVRLIVSLPDAAFPFDLTGRVIRAHSYDPESDQVPGMGIEFIDVDEEKHARLERFVDRLRKELPDEAPAPAKPGKSKP